MSRTVGAQHCAPQHRSQQGWSLGFWLAEGMTRSITTCGRECIAMQEPPTLPGDLDEIPCPLLAPTAREVQASPTSPWGGSGVFKVEPV